jgi:hypothetical protein
MPSNGLALSAKKPSHEKKLELQSEEGVEREGSESDKRQPVDQSSE